MRRVVLLACVVACPLTAFAETAQKPGLWEVTLNMHLAGRETPVLPPEVVEKMNDLGIEVPFGQPLHHQVCLTPEQVAKNAVPNFQDPESGCRMTNGKRVGDRFTADMQCDGQYTGQGKAQMIPSSPETYTGNAAFRGTGADGFNVDMTSDFTGKWLAASCGNVQAYR